MSAPGPEAENLVQEKPKDPDTTAVALTGLLPLAAHFWSGPAMF